MLKTDMIKLDEFITMAQYGWFVFDRELEHYELVDSIHMLCPQWTAEEEVDLGGFLVNIRPDAPYRDTFGRGMPNHWHRQIAKIKELRKPFDFWLVFEQRKRTEGPGWKMSDCQMPPDEYEYMMREVGSLFLGWEIGEFDGLYCRDVVRYWQPDDYPKTRREAHDRLVDYLRDMHKRLYGNTNAQCGATFAHYFNEIPVRMIGAEVGQGLLNNQVFVSFLRGACRQYGFQYKLMSSVFSRWGYNCYTDSGQVVQAREDGDCVWEAGPYWGHSIGLLNAIWVTGYFAEAMIVGLDGGFYSDDLTDGVRQLSSLGRAFQDFTEWSRNPLPRGRQIRPLAIMLDYYAGWTPPRHLYSFEERVVWHSIPYGLSDHAMDRAYDTFYPGYCQSGFYMDERGFITPTPAGDAVDVLLSDANIEAMQSYPVLWLISDEVPDENLMERLREYVTTGGHLIVSGTPMFDVARGLCSLTIPREKTPAFRSVISTTGEEVREALFSVYATNLDQSWQVYAETEAGDPIIVVRDTGKGKISLILADHGLTNDMTAPAFDQIPYLTYKPDPPLELLHCVQRYVKSCVGEHVPVEVSGKVYWSVNDLADGRFVVCLYNPGHDDWSGLIRSKLGDEILEEVDGPWVGAAYVEGSKVRLPGNSTAVFMLRA